MDSELLQKLAVVLGLGLLVGLQREKVRDPLAGIRTFALLSLLGAVCGLLAESLGAWIIGLGMIGVAVLFVAGYFGHVHQARELARHTPHVAESESGAGPSLIPPQVVDTGLTTEIAALFMFSLGAYLMVGHIAIGAVLGGAVFVLLHLKDSLHSLVGKLAESDLHAILQFVLIALIILPILPDEGYGPWEVLNPHHIWLMVVLIVGISLGGYVAFKLLGGTVGAFLSGILGGLISSTATTVSYARRSSALLSASAANLNLVVSVLLLATAVSQARVLGEIAVVAPWYWWRLSLPLLVFLIPSVVVPVYLIARLTDKSTEIPEQKNPAELQSALIFGGLYAAVTLAVAAANQWLGDSGMVAVAVLSGLHDMDAITLTTARLVNQQEIDPSFAWKLILIATLSNIVMKTGYTFMLGTRVLAARLAIWNGVFLVVGIALLFLFPW